MAALPVLFSGGVRLDRVFVAVHFTVQRQSVRSVRSVRSVINQK